MAVIPRTVHLIDLVFVYTSYNLALFRYCIELLHKWALDNTDKLQTTRHLVIITTTTTEQVRGPCIFKLPTEKTSYRVLHNNLQLMNFENVFV